MESQPKILNLGIILKTFTQCGYVSMGVYIRHLRICDKHRNLVCWPICIL